MKTKLFSPMIVHVSLVSVWFLSTAVPLVVRGAENAIQVELKSPLKNISSLEGLLVAILNIVMIFMVPVMVFFIIFAGFKYVMARGNASQVEEATRSLTYAVIGGVLVLGALAITQIIKNVVEAF